MATNMQAITDNLDLWTSALLTKSTAGRGSNGRVEAYGIKKLRELILELAVRGKLVPQVPIDEPAAKLLERIKTEKARLVKEKIIRKADSLLSVKDDEAPYKLPQGWEWMRLGSLGITQTGSTPPSTNPEYFGNDYPFIKPADISDKGVRYDSGEGLSQKGIEKGRFIPAYSVLMVCIGGSISKVNFIDRDCSCNQQINTITPYDGIDFRMLRCFMASSFFKKQILENAPSTTLPILSKGKWETLPIPLPPLAEQHRIVAKVDELMALCDQLEQQQTNNIEAHQTLVETLLGTLTNVASQEEFTEAWTRIADHFDTLFTTEQSIDQLKQTILQLAVMGKLVPQEANDEDVKHILVRNDERRRKIATSDRRADADLQSILSAEDIWKTPETWAWRGLADLVLFVDYRGKTPEKLPSGIRLLTAKNVRKGQIDLMPEEFLSEQDYSDWMTRGLPLVGDVLFTTEVPMGNAAVVELTEQFALAQRVICFQGYGALAPSFLTLQILSEQFQFILDKNGTGMTAKGIKASKLKMLPIAIPPLAEQHRIVAKVNELMTLCDTLKEHLSAAQTTQIHLSDTIVEQALS